MTDLESVELLFLFTLFTDLIPVLHLLFFMCEGRNFEIGTPKSITAGKKQPPNNGPA